jgi:hypothetical protein
MLNTGSGAVELRQILAGVDLAYAFGLERRRFYPVVSLGGGLYDLQYAGEAVAPQRGARGGFVTAALFAGAGVGARLHPRVSAFSDVQVVVVQKEPVVTVLGAPAGSAGRPALLPSIGLVTHF